ncbi:MAG TPA: PilZ domain-containing protein [Vicinamibacteria bacterium]|nr:PilZ domain-containing protein [Vicinamibacteria bacterium]
MILVVGGCPEDGRWLEDALRPSGLPVAVLSLDQALALRSSGPGRIRPTVVILHERRQREDLLATLDQFRRHPVLRRAPLVVVDREKDIERFTAAVAHGAAACICPPFDPVQLRGTVARLARWRDKAATGEQQLRRRRPLLLRVDLHLPGERVVEGLLRDVSNTGCRVEAPADALPGTDVAITPYGYDSSMEFRVSARVRRHTETEPGRHMLACRFVGTGALMAPRLFAVQPLSAAPPAPPAPEPAVRG